ncbi:ATP-binding protein [Desulfobacterales bacterium HSG2]|nr:ATP-binding protein [Desulfobacterales bacterium HSG2]
MDQSKLIDLINMLDMLVMERTDQGSFRAAGSVPHFFKRFFEKDARANGKFALVDRFPFLENFLTDAKDIWMKDEKAMLKSGPWTETDISGNDHELEATAISLGGTKLLLIEKARFSPDERRDILQRGRESSLEYHETRKSHKKEIRAADEKLGAIFDSASDGILATDNQFAVIRANPVCSHFLKTRAEDLVGQNFLDLINVPVLKESILLMADEPESKFRFKLKTARRSLSASVSRLQGDNGYVFVLSDRTAEKKAEDLKNEFVNILTRKLAPLLDRMMGALRIVARRFDGEFEKELEHLHRMCNAGNEMGDIIRELHDFVDKKPLKKKFAEGEIQIVQVLDRVISSLREEMEEKDITAEFAERLPHIAVKGEKAMILELFYNIIQNAVVFNKDGGHIRVRMKEKGGKVEVGIADSGVGIPEDALGDVFNSYYRVPDHQEMNFGGLGLGLSVAKHIVEFYEGEIWIRSRQHEGTIVFVTLPATG